MSDDGKTSGRCLCGAVTITVTASHKHVEACHCTMCRRWGGGPLMAIDIGNDIAIDGTDHIATYRSSAWAERAFCSNCGTNLYYRLVEANQYALCAGVLDDEADLVLTGQIFIDEKPAYYDLANQTKTMTGAEVFAMYAPPDDGAS